MDEVTFLTFVLAAAIAYGLGTLPVAYVAGKINGVDVFEVGSRQAGATNVFREVSRKVGVAVTFIDSIKGLTAILIARYLGLDGGELLVPAVAAIAGHWNSPFTRFKGGDGVLTLLGTALGIAPIALLGPVVLATTISVVLNSKLKHPSLWGGAGGYLLFIALSFLPNSNTAPAVVYGLTGLGVGVLLHSMYFHKRHRHYFQTPESLEDESDSTLTQDGLG